MNENTHHLEPDMQNQRRDIESIQRSLRTLAQEDKRIPFPECRRPVRAGNRSVRKGVSAYIRSAGYRKRRFRHLGGAGRRLSDRRLSILRRRRSLCSLPPTPC